MERISLSLGHQPEPTLSIVDFPSGVLKEAHQLEPGSSQGSEESQSKPISLSQGSSRLTF